MSVSSFDARPKKFKVFVWAGFGVGALWWLLESLIHMTFFDHEPFFQALLPSDPMEIWMRSFVAFLLIGLGLISQYWFNREVRSAGALTESEERYRELVEGTDDFIIRVDTEGRFTYVNHTARRILGIAPENCIGLSAFDFVHPDDRERTQSWFDDQINSRNQSASFENRQVSTTGSVHDMLWTTNLHYNNEGVPIGMSSIARDITERKKAELEFSRTEYFLREAQQIARLGYYVFDIASGTWTSSELLDEVFGIDEKFERDVPGWLAIAHPDQRDEMFEYLQKHVLTEHKPFDREYRIIHQASGESRWVHGLGRLEFNDEGAPTLMIGTIRDITDRKLAEAALKESEERYRFLFEKASDAIFIVQDEKVKFPNPKTLDLLGFSEEELASGHFFDRIHPLDQEMVRDRHRMRIEGQQLPPTYEFRILGRDDAEIWVQLNTALVSWEGRPGTLNFLRDITEQKKLESQLYQAQKMEAMGTLAGGIAHDFNNILTSIAGNISLIQLKSALNPEDVDKLKQIQSQIMRAADLTAQLLGVARGGKYEVKPLSINNLLQDTSEMFGRTRREISIHCRLNEDLWNVEADKNQIEQVLLNCYLNAWKAMPEGGELYLSTQNETLDENYTQEFEFQPGRYVKISITDTGIGMDEKTRLRVFDPFFTTSAIGHGTGLGLASAYGIIKNHSGIITVYSELGHGSTFNIYLPASDKKVSSEKKPITAGVPGTETILLVDDEPFVVQVGKEMLQQLGYTMHVASTGKEALDIFKANPGSIDLVILDMIMPEMGGGTTFDKLKELDPDVRVLLASGYSLNGQATDILDRGCKGFIQKPFDLIAISAKVREVLDEE